MRFLILLIIARIKLATSGTAAFSCGQGASSENQGKDTPNIRELIKRQRRQY
jgi:hypothetical protein